MTQHQHTDYTSPNIVPHNQYTPVSRERQPQTATMTKRIGSTTYRVRVHFSNTSRETMNEKILRLAKSEVSK